MKGALATGASFSLPAFLRSGSIDDIDAALCRKSLPEFCRTAWPILEPSTPLVWGWHLDAMCEHLDAVARGQILRLIINVPPGHMKSLLVNVMWPAWMWASKPEWRWLFSSYAAALVRRDALKFRALLGSEWYATVCRRPVTLIKDTEDWLTNTATGFRRGLSVGGVTTGERADGAVVDDPLNATDAQSQAAIEACLWWWDQGMANRLNDMERGFQVLIMQRLHVKDLSGHLLRLGGWEHLCLPTEYDPARRCVTSLGWSDPRTKAGELLFPQRFSAKVIASEKRRLGSYGYAGQHQQLPAPAGGGKFQSAWFRYFERETNHYVLHRPGKPDKRWLIGDCWTFQTIDLAMSEDEDRDYTVISTWAVTPDNELLLIDVKRFRAESPEVKRELINARHKWQPDYQAIESAHYGVNVCQEWVRAGMPLRVLVAKKDKVTRSIQAQLMLENGRVYFMANAPWLVDFETELTRFPVAEHDDQVDTLSYAAIEVGNRAPGGIEGETDEDGEPIQQAELMPIDLGPMNELGN